MPDSTPLRPPPLNDWFAPYWKPVPHGKAWKSSRASLEADWNRSSGALRPSEVAATQEVTDTIRRLSDTIRSLAATMEAAAQGLGDAADDLRVSTQAVAAGRVLWTEISTAVRYGFGARLEYGAVYPQWNETVDSRLASEWDEANAGRSFAEVLPWVQRGWHSVDLRGAPAGPLS